MQSKIEDLGNHQIKYSFGDDEETITIDGKEHPTKHGGTAITTVEGPNQWRDVVMKDGKIVHVEHWTLSEDGQRFTTVDDRIRPDGSTDSIVYKTKRVAGTSGLAGTWEDMEADPKAFPDVVIAPF